MSLQRACLALVLATTILAGQQLSGQQLCGEAVDAKWLTAPEANGWKQTSTSAEVRGFLARLHAGFPRAFTLSTIGKTLQGRAIQLVTVKRPGAQRLRAVILANIHGGEVEGKEAVQVLLREIAQGGHADLLKEFDIWFVPIFNVDGNDEINAANRTSQNGPDAVGKRANSQQFDLNRDFVKVESPEARALLGLMRRVDPHVFMDLHTTNGSPHGYHLTYSPSLSTNQDPKLDSFMHEQFIPSVRAAMSKRHGFRIFDYGNFPRRGDPETWTTFSHQPRLVFNYVGLRNRISVLSEAYSYLPFKQRALVTRAFVLETLRETVRRKSEVLEICAQADRRVLAGGMKFGYANQLSKPVRGDILVGRLGRGPGRRRVATASFTPVKMDVRVRFEARKFIPYPQAWAVVGASDLVRQTLMIHGVQVERLAAQIEVQAESFAVSGMSRARYRMQGHNLTTIRGKLVAGKHTLPAGTLIVHARQAAARLAAQLLEGHSEDSLATWNFFDQQIKKSDDGAELGYPVLRVTAVPEWKTQRLAIENEVIRAAGAYSPAPDEIPADAIVVKMVCVAPGRRTGNNDFGRRARWVDRKVRWTVGPDRFTDAVALRAGLVKHFGGKKSVCVIAAGPAIINSELIALSKLLSDVGATKIYLERKPE